MYKTIAVIVFCVFLGACVQKAPTKNELGKMSAHEINEMLVDLNDKGKSPDPRTIIEYAELANSKNPDYGRAYYTKGFAHYDLKEYDLAIAAFSKAIELDPYIQETYNSRGWVYLEVGEYENAINDFTEAIKIDNEFRLAINNRGHTYMLLDKLDQGCADLRRACSMGSCQRFKKAKAEGNCE